MRNGASSKIGKADQHLVRRLAHLADRFQTRMRENVQNPGRVVDRGDRCVVRQLRHRVEEMFFALFAFAFSPASCVRSSTVAPFLFWRNAEPINPITTKTPPAIISQCGYCIAESMLN